MLAKLGLKPEDVEYMQSPAAISAWRSIPNFERGGQHHGSASAGGDSLSGLGGCRGAGIRSSATPTSTRAFRDQNRDTVQRFIKALVEGTHWVKDPKNRPAVRQLISRRLRTDDPAVLDLNYRMYVEPLSPFPDTDLDDLKTNLAQLAENNARLRDLNLANFVDNSFIQRLQRR
jgi:hypothetical protein